MKIKEQLRLSILPILVIDESLPDTGLIYEIGSGYGVIGAYLATSKKRRVIVCLDFDADKIKEARKSFQLPNLTLTLADSTTFRYERSQGALLSDFLHHISYTKQEQLLKSLANILVKTGVLVIKEIAADDGWRTWASRFWDFIFYPHDTIYYRSKSSWYNLLISLGFKVRVRREVRWFPGSTFLYICTKN